ncbi:hypothetical protein SPI_04056 [Niveomyces insectorum RCEF 264]|uniref:Uncharacterized protein n=1 Tax=Niveomyces insectorum RCEF 264 TaxID=1081102 RepID=A0A167VE73_9HYPO|nr:hypothetical protein SPI_04056 [Niveomyces insectorum RCEF 264]
MVASRLSLLLLAVVSSCEAAAAARRDGQSHNYNNNKIPRRQWPERRSAGAQRHGAVKPRYTLPWPANHTVEDTSSSSSSSSSSSISDASDPTRNGPTTSSTSSVVVVVVQTLNSSAVHGPTDIKNSQGISSPFTSQTAADEPLTQPAGPTAHNASRPIQAPTANSSIASGSVAPITSATTTTTTTTTSSSSSSSSSSSDAPLRFPGYSFSNATRTPGPGVVSRNGTIVATSLPPAWQTFLSHNASWFTAAPAGAPTCRPSWPEETMTVYTTVFETVSSMSLTATTATPRPAMPTVHALPTGGFFKRAVTGASSSSPSPETISATTGRPNLMFPGTATQGSTINYCLMNTLHSPVVMLHCWTALGTQSSAAAAADRVTTTTTFTNNTNRAAAAATTTAAGNGTSCFVQTISDSAANMFMQGVTVTTTYVTVKVPQVATSAMTTPSYGDGGSGGSAWSTYVNHDQATHSASPFVPPTYPVPPGDGSVATPVAIALPPGAVIIDGHTYADGSGRPQTAPEVVTVGPNVFTIASNEVVGMGTTLLRPSYVPSYGGGGGGGSGGSSPGGNTQNENIDPLDPAVYAATPTSTVMAGGLTVAISGTQVFVDGTPFVLPAQPSLATVRGGAETVALGPDGVLAGGQTLRVTPVVVAAGPTAGANAGGGGGSGGDGAMSEVIVAGGDLVTLLGPTAVAVDGTTRTYGGGALSHPETIMVAGDPVTIGPAGVVVHGTTLGGPGVPAGATRYELVGGATFTEVGASVAVVNGRRFTLGPALAGTGVSGTNKNNIHNGPPPLATPFTTEVNGQTMTIGPGGVTVGPDLTFSYPFVPTMTLTPPPATAGGTALSAGGAKGAGGGGAGDGTSTTPTAPPKKNAAVAAGRPPTAAAASAASTVWMLVLYLFLA